MIRILIVDDEILVRIGLKTIIPIDNDEFQVIGEASNGVEALAILESNPCEIVLMDIRMPEMDGLELMKRIRERWPSIKCLVLSNHNDFPFVQQALRLGAIEYITKLEINPSELMLKLRTIKDQLLLEKQGQSAFTELEHKVSQYSAEVKEKRLRELVLGHCSRMEIKQVFNEFRIESFPSLLTVVAIQIESYEDLMINNRFQSERLLNYTVRNVLGEVLKKYGNGELIEIGSGRFCVLTGDMNADMLAEMHQAVASFLKISIACGISPAYSDVFALNAAYEKADYALSYRFYYESGCTISSEQVGVSSPGPHESWEEEEWKKRLEEQDESGLQQRIQALAQSALAAKNVPPAIVREQWVQLLNLFSSSLKAEGIDIYSVALHENKYPYHVIRSSEKLQELADWFEGWIPVYFQYKRQHGKERFRPEIQSVIRLIMEQYNMPIKVADLAGKVGYSENYLSILFKKETGKTITDYITNIRMKTARELLKNPAYKIFEISEQIGYADPNHFSRSFKQIEGMYPTEFRKLYMGRT